MDNTSEKMFDLSYLNQIFQGNTSMINSIIEMFLKQVPDYISEMESCVSNDDFIGLHPLAHKAKSSIAMLGLKKMEKIVLEVERLSKNRIDFEKLPDLVDNIRMECNNVYGPLENIITPNKVA